MGLFKPGDKVKVLEDRPSSSILKEGDICIVVQYALNMHNDMDNDMDIVWVKVVNPSKLQIQQMRHNGSPWYVKSHQIQRIDLTKLEKVLYNV